MESIYSSKGECGIFAQAFRKVVILGSGGHAKVVIDLLLSDPSLQVIGCTGNGGQLRVPILGDDSVLPELYLQGVHHAFIAVGNNLVRSRLSSKVDDLGFQLVNAISPFSHLSDSVTLGTGIAIMPGAIVNADASIGDLSILNTGASVDHDTRIGVACHIAPGCNLAGNVSVGDFTFMGTGAKVIDGIRIGRHCVIGAGAVVIHDIPDGSTAVGVPARIIKSQGNS